MKVIRLLAVLAVVLASGVLALSAGASPVAAPMAGPCGSGDTYDPACDVDHNGTIDITDIQLAAGHWGHTGTFTSDNDHEHLDQVWSRSRVPLKIQSNFDGTGGSRPAALVLTNTRTGLPGHGMWVESVNGVGVNVNAAGTGVYVNAAVNDGVYVCATGSASGCTASAENNGVEVGNAEGNGVFVKAAGNDGVVVSAAGDDGVYVNTATDDGLSVGSVGGDGLQVAFANSGHGVNVLNASNAGVFVDSAAGDGLRVCTTGSATSCTASSDNNGIEIGSAQHDGVRVSSAGDDGIYINSAADVGVYVCRTGSATSCSPSTYHNGVEVGNAQDDGFHVVNAGKYGLYVNDSGYGAIHVAGTSGDGVDISADDYGVVVSSAGLDGLKVLSAANDGIDVTGSNLAGYFNGSIQVTGGCIGCTLTAFAVNAGDRPLAPGELVALAGLREGGVDGTPVLMEVRPAGDDGAVVGVVQSRAELVAEGDPRPGEMGLRLAPREGTADPGEYVVVAYSGLIQVRANGPIAAGSRLATGADGLARALRIVSVDGVELAENVPIVGVALEGLDSGQGLVWTLVDLH